MPQVSTSENPAEAQALLRSALSGLEPEAPPAPPEMSVIEDTHFKLAGGVLLDDGRWITDFEVRELTGRDEEALTRTRDDNRFFRMMLELGLVSVGGAPANKDTPDFLLAGDWNTILLAIRAVTFGREYTYTGTCANHGGPFTATIDVIKDIPYTKCNREDVYFNVIGRKGTRYRVSHVFGSTQQVIMGMVDKSPGEIASYMLGECVSEIDGHGMVFPADQARNIPWADRRKIIDKITESRVGPDLEAVKTQCPECGAEQGVELGIAALFL